MVKDGTGTTYKVYGISQSATEPQKLQARHKEAAMSFSFTNKLKGDSDL